MVEYGKAIGGMQAPQSTDLGNINARLRSLIQELQKDGEVLYQVANRVTGSVPEESAEPRSGPAAVPNGAISEINEALDAISRIVGHNRDIMRRLENLA